MNITEIEWCDQTWNPITGCLHDCAYCYARGIARRFTGTGDLREKDTGFLYDDHRIEAWSKEGRGSVIKKGDTYEIRYPLTRGECPTPGQPYKGKATHYPFGFAPTLHRYRLTEPQEEKKPQDVFVGSMADVFGEWVPVEWIAEVLMACEDAPQHRYLFLTKNPERYLDLLGILPKANAKPECWYGTTITNKDDRHASGVFNVNTFLSIEPIQERLNVMPGSFGRNKWVIIGAESGNRKSKVKLERGWIKEIVEVCAADKIPIFMKNSLADIWGEPLIQEYPWEVRG